MRRLLRSLRSLRLSNGFYIASTTEEYQYTWLRDNFYCSLPELIFNPKNYAQTFHSWLDHYRDWIYNSLDRPRTLPHVKMNLDMSPLETGWNHAQFDTIGYFLFGVALGEKSGLKILRDVKDWSVIVDLMKFLDTINYTEYPECGAWEENNESPRISSIGAIVAGLEAIKNLEQYSWPKPLVDRLISQGIEAIQAVFPNETPSREVDLAQLFLLFPFTIFTTRMEDVILSRVHERLEKENGLIRYENDLYFNASSPGIGYHNHLYNPEIKEAYGNEAEWPFGFIYLGLIYLKRGNIKKAEYYYNKVQDQIKLPELYVKGVSNGNEPLGWGVALLLILKVELKRHKSKWYDIYCQIRNRRSFIKQ